MDSILEGKGTDVLRCAKHPAFRTFLKVKIMIVIKVAFCSQGTLKTKTLMPVITSHSEQEAGAFKTPWSAAQTWQMF